MLRLFISIFVVQLLVGCASNSISNVRKLSDNSQVMVVSSIGDELKLYSIGTTAFNNGLKVMDASNWQVDSLLENEAERLIESSRFSVVKSQSDEKFPVFGDDSWSGEVEFNGAKQKLQEIALANNADVILVIHEMHRGDPIFNTNQRIVGYGFYERSFFGTEKKVGYAYFGVSLYEAKSMKKLVGRAGWENLPSDVMLEDLTDENLESNKDFFKQLLFNNIQNVMKTLTII